MPELTCFRLLDAESPAGPLAEAVRQVNVGQGGSAVFALDPASFEQVPNTPFAYWVSEQIRRLFKELEPFESAKRTARQGLASADDFRYVRCWWETATGDDWKPFAKGGDFSPFYADVYMRVNWRDDGRELKSSQSARVQNTDFYFQAGAYQTMRSRRLSPHITPRGCVFSHNGFQYFAPEEQLAFLLGLTNSSFFESLFRLSVGNDEAPNFFPGVMQLVPVPRVKDDLKGKIADLAYACWLNRRRIAVRSERSPWFRRPTAKAPSIEASDDSERALRAELDAQFIKLQADIEQLVLEAYGDITPIIGGHSSRSRKNEEIRDEDEPVASTESTDLAKAKISYVVGLSFGRWKRCALDPDENLPSDLLTPLPLVPPGFSSTGQNLFLLDETSDESGLIDAVRTNLAEEFGSNAEEVLCAQMGFSDLRSYLEKPAGFFAHHLAVYSKSRRQAPVYWPLSTRSGDLVIWINFIKLDANSLPRLITEVIDPRLRRISEELADVAADLKAGVRKAKLEALRLELAEMRQDFQELIAKGYKPDLNDGVLITACPLAKYFRHAGFRKNLEACWKELSRGDYDWSHLAMAMWPERVLAVCKKDRSIAIAHGREDLCPAEPPKAARGRKKKSV
jgi:hypothetical protein